MLNHLRGTITEKSPAHLVLEVAGIGYYVNISVNTFSQITKTEDYRLLVHQVIREDAHSLYGFASEEERSLFRHLISVSGIGPNTARMMFSSYGPSEIQQAIATDDVNLLKSIKGIGAKTAQRIIVELRDKIGKLEFTEENNLTPSNNTSRDEALSALVALGFDKSSSTKAIRTALQKQDLTTAEDIIKAALRLL